MKRKKKKKNVGISILRGACVAQGRSAAANQRVEVRRGWQRWRDKFRAVTLRAVLVSRSRVTRGRITRHRDVDSLLRDPQALQGVGGRDRKAAEARQSDARQQNQHSFRSVRRSVYGNEVSPLKLPARRTRLTAHATPRELSKRGHRARDIASVYFSLISKGAFHLALATLVESFPCYSASRINRDEWCSRTLQAKYEISVKNRAGNFPT